MFNPANIQMGMTVRDREGEQLGTILSVDAAGFFIGKGRLFTRDYRVSFSDVTDIDRDDVYLRESLEEMPGVRQDALTERHGRSVPGVALRHDLTGGLGLEPGDLEQARMDSAKFQDHGRYDLGQGAASRVEGRERRHEVVISEAEPSRAELARAEPSRAEPSEVDPTVVAVSRPPVVERRAARDEDDLPRREAPTERDPHTRR